MNEFSGQVIATKDRFFWEAGFSPTEETKRTMGAVCGPEVEGSSAAVRCSNPARSKKGLAPDRPWEITSKQVPAFCSLIRRSLFYSGLGPRQIVNANHMIQPEPLPSCISLTLGGARG